MKTTDNNKQPNEGNIKDIHDCYSVKNMNHTEYNQFLKYLDTRRRFPRVPSIFYQ